MGLATVEELVQRGWNVAILDKDHNAGKQVSGRLGGQVQFFDIDVTDYDQQAEAFVKTWDKWRRIDLGKRQNFVRLTI